MSDGTTAEQRWGLHIYLPAHSAPEMLQSWHKAESTKVYTKTTLWHFHVLYRALELVIPCSGIVCGDLKKDGGPGELHLK